jgi:hypothetical protein
LYRRLDGPQIRSPRGRDEQNSQPLPGIEYYVIGKEISLKAIVIKTISPWGIVLLRS